MEGKFIPEPEIEMQGLDWGLGKQSSSQRRGTVGDRGRRSEPGKGHSFHKHPGQEEVMYVVSGKVEQWIDKKKRVLGAGDSAFLPPGVVHASFNAGDTDARVMAIFSPCVGDGFEMVDMAGESPWNSLRG
jgi:oxalate decarboxylase/phosphoglucose isomerase-like protein (cupin superfamily)